MIKLNTHKSRGRTLLSKIVPTVLTCLAMILMFGTNAKAQTYFSESFEGNWFLNGDGVTAPTTAGKNAPAGWTQIRPVNDVAPTGCVTSGAKDWGQMTYASSAYTSSQSYPTGCSPWGGAPSSAPIAGTKTLWFYDGYCSTGNTRLIATPAVNLTSSTAPIASFSYSYAGAGAVTFMGSLDGGTTWNSLGSVAATAASSWATRIVTIPAAYKIASAKFGLQIVSTYGSYDIFVDDFKVREGVAPASPITFATNTITGNSFNVTWVDNSTNETSFKVYRSTDNINFTLVNTTTSTTGAATGGAYSLAQTALSPGTTYYYQITSLFEGESAPLTGSQALAAGTTYTWNQTVSGSYATATNWTPTRTTPSTSDILIFDGSVTPAATVIGFATQSIGQLIVKNNATVLFSSPATATLTLIGGGGKDFDIQAGSTFRLNAGFALGLNFTGTGHEGNIAGTFEVANTVASTINFTNSIDTVTATGTYAAGGSVSHTTTAGTAVLYVAGVYEHKYTTVAGAIPTATWLTGSTVLISGYTTATAGPTGLAQTFQNFTWNCPSQTGNLNLTSASTTTVANAFSMISTGTGQCRWTATGTYTLNIKDYTQTGGWFDMASGASGASASMNVSGTFNQTAGTFLASGTATSNPTLNFNGILGNQAVTFTTNPTGPITYRVSNGMGITLTGPTATFALGNGTLGGLRISTKFATPVTFAGTSTSFAYNAANSTLTYDTAASFSMTATEFPATAGPARLTVAVGAANTIAMPFSRALSQTTANSILTMASGNIDLGTTSSTLTLGANATYPGTLTWTSGGFTAGSTLTRYWPTTTGGASITASTTTANASSAGLYPFVSGTTPNFVNRTMFLNQTTAATTAGAISVKFNNVAGNSAVSITDGAYTATSQSNSNWVVTNTAVGSAYSMAISAQSLYIAANGNSRITNPTAAAAGTHQTGTSYVNGQRTAIPAASLSGTYHLSVAENDLPNATIAAGAWEDPSIWSKGIVPTCSDSAVILHAVDINATGNFAKSLTIATGGVLNSLAGGDLTVSYCTAGVNLSSFNIDGGTYNNSGGDLIVNGKFTLSGNAAGQFIQSAGNITVDPNSGTLATSVLGHSVDMYCHTTSTLQLTGGNFTVVDPTASTATGDYSFKIYPSIPHGSGPNWNLKFGNGLSNTAGGHANGLYVNLQNSNTFKIGGTITVDMLGGTNRFVNIGNTFSGTNLNIISGDCRLGFGSYNNYFSGNIVNNGTLTTLYYLYMANFNGTTESASTQAQSITGSGVFRNSATTTTASVYGMYINNTSTSGVTLGAPLSVANTFGLTAGKLNTDATNVLRIGSILGTPTAGSLTYTVNQNTYINGPLERVFTASRTAAQTYSTTTMYPVGCSDTLRPFYVDPSTNASGPIVVKVTPTCSNSGTNGGGVSNMAKITWAADIVSGSANFTGTYVAASNYSPDFVSTKKIVHSATAGGSYSGTPGGSVYVAGTPNTLRSALISSAAFLNNFSYADLVPCTAPVDQGTLSNSFMTSTTFTGTITAAASLPTAYLLVRYPAGATPVAPTDGVTYLVGGTLLGTGTTLGSATTTTAFNFAATGLTANTSYDYYAYAFNNSGCAGPVYNVLAPSFMNITTCAATNGTPGTPVASATTITSFDATWTASSTSGVNYLVDVSTSSTFASYVSGYNKLNVGTALTTPITGLTAATKYYVRVWAVLGSCYSLASTTMANSTLCNPVAGLPWTENFDSYTYNGTTVPTVATANIPSCWIDVSTANAFTIHDAAAQTYNDPKSGSSYLTVYYPYQYTSTSWTPTFTLTAGTSYDFSFWWAGDGYAGWNNTIWVNNTTSLTGATLIDTFVKPTTTTVANSYTYKKVTFVPTTTGVYTFGINTYCSTTAPYYMGFDDFELKATPSCSGMPSGGTIAISATSGCGTSNSASLSSSGASYSSGLGITYQWQSSTDGFVSNINNISGATNPSAASTGTTSFVGTNSYRLKVSCTTSGLDAYSNVVTFNYSNPQLLSTTGNTRCGTGTTTLNATANPGDNINWYAAATGGSPLGTGTSFTTPSILATTNYYASASSGGVTVSAGLPDNTGSYGTYGSPGGSGYGIYFTTTSAATLNSVYVYPQGAGTATIQLQDGTGALIGTNQVIATFSAGDVGVKTLVNLGFAIPSAGSYRLMNTAGTTYFGRYNPYSGTAFPLTIPSGIITLTQGSAGTTTYYSFFDWSVSTGCEGTRTAVAATVTAPPTFTISSNAVDVCQGSSSSAVNVTSTLGNYNSYSWSPAATGTTSATFNPSVNTTYTITASNSTTGCASTATVLATMRSVPLVTSTTATPSSICEGGTVNLDANAVTTGSYSMNTSGTQSFIDIASTGTSLGTLADDDEYNITFPAFYFNGVSYTDARLGTNGVIALGATTGDVPVTNATLPTTTVTAGNILLSPYWDDLDVNLLGTIYTETVGNKYIIQYNAIDHNLFTTGTIKFQVQLDLTTGQIHYVYNDVIFGSATYDAGVSATIGIQYSATDALQYSYNTASLTNGQCISFTPPSITNYGWSGPNSFTSSVKNPSITSITAPATGNYQVTATNSYGCTATGIANVIVKLKATKTVNDTICTTAFPYSWNGQTINAAGNYTHTQTGSNGCDSITTLALVTKSCAANVNLTAFIQGYYVGPNMVAARYDNLVAAGSSTPGAATDVDSVIVELHDASTYALSYTTTGILQTNGSLNVVFPGAAVGTSYYIVLKHQSSLQLWSAAPVAITSTTTYNFSTALTQAYTDGSTDPMALLATGIYGMYSGDINQDEYIDGSDYSLYEADVDNSNNLGLFSLPSDLNGDTYVDGSDYPVFDANSSNNLYSQHP